MTKVLLFALIGVGLMIGSLVLASLWVYRDAKRRGLQAGLWALITLFCGYFVGLILYLAVGRKQERIRCPHCGGDNLSPAAFCSSCGQAIERKEPEKKPKSPLLVACIACIPLAFVSLGLFAVSMLDGDGFTPSQQYSMYEFKGNASAENVSQNCSGDTWELSFAKASYGYLFSQSYNSAGSLKTLEIKATGKGSMDVVVRKDGNIQADGRIEEGEYVFDLSSRGPGRYDIRIFNIDAEDFAATMTVTR